MLRSQNILIPTDNEKKFNTGLSDKTTLNNLEINPFLDNFSPYLKQNGTRKSFYSRAITTPVKVKNDYDQENLLSTHYDSTIDKNNQYLIGKIQGFNDSVTSFFPRFDGKENDFFSPNLHSLSTANTNRFSSNSNARNQVKYLISDGKPLESKPTLNMVESRNKLIAFSKTRKFENEQMEFNRLKRDEPKEISITQSEEKKSDEKIPDQKEVNSSCVENSAEELKEESEEDAYNKKIKDQIANLPVPLNKKDDENFKLLKMKEMKKKSLPPNKSAKAYDADLVPAHQRDMINGIYL